MGFAPSKGRRCRNPIACVNRQQAAKILLQMSRRHPQSQRVDYLLEELASRLLCRRWHQDQAAGITRQWQDNIDDYQAAEDDRRCERMDDPMDRLITAVAVRVEQSIVARMPPAPVRSTVARTRATSHRTDRNTSSVAPLRILGPSSVTPSVATRERSRVRDHNEPNGEEAEQQTNSEPDPPSQQQASLRETNHCENNPSPRSSADELTAHTNDASLGEPVAMTREEVTSEGDTEEHAIEALTQAQRHEESPHFHDHRPIEGNCSICFEELSSGDDIAWCQAQCKQNFHADCVNTWDASRVADRLKIYPYWQDSPRISTTPWKLMGAYMLLWQIEHIRHGGHAQRGRCSFFLFLVATVTVILHAHIPAAWTLGQPYGYRADSAL